MPQWCNQDLSSGGQAREIFANSCMNTAFYRTLKAIITGSLCRGIDQFPPLFLFLLNLSQIFFFFFLSFLSVFLFFLLFSVFYFSFFPSLFLFFPFLFSFCFLSPVRQGGTLPPLPYPLLFFNNFSSIILLLIRMDNTTSQTFPLPHPVVLYSFYC